jgi:hypothetical protein
MSRAMQRTLVAALAAVVVSTALVASALADTYPPGPGNCCPDTLTIINLRNPAAVPHPSNGDDVLGVGGIVTAFSHRVGRMASTCRCRTVCPTAASPCSPERRQHAGATGRRLGRRVRQGQPFQRYRRLVIGAPPSTRLTNLTDNNVLVRRVSSGNPLPPIHVGTLAELESSASNTLGDPWLNMVVRLRWVEAINSDGETFNAIDPLCATNCLMAFVDGSYLTDVAAPPSGTMLSALDGVVRESAGHAQILLRNGDDFTIGHPPAADRRVPDLGQRPADLRPAGQHHGGVRPPRRGDERRDRCELLARFGRHRR